MDVGMVVSLRSNPRKDQRVDGAHSTVRLWQVLQVGSAQNQRHHLVLDPQLHIGAG